MDTRGAVDRIRYRAKEIGLDIRAYPERVVSYTLAGIATVLSIRDVYEKADLVAILLMLMCFAGVIALVYAHRPDTSGDLPVGEMPAPYKIEIPPSDEIVRAAIKKSQKLFGDAAIDPDKDWIYYASDPYSIVALTDANERLVGFIDFYFFDEVLFGQYLKDEISFEDLLDTGLLEAPRARRAKIAYVATHVHFGYLNESEFWRSRENALLVWGAAQMLLRFQHFPDEGLDFYSVGWSKEGASILKHAAFKSGGAEAVIRTGVNAGKTLYRRSNVTRDDLLRLKKPYDRFSSRLCDIVIDGKAV